MKDVFGGKWKMRMTESVRALEIMAGTKKVFYMHMLKRKLKFENILVFQVQLHHHHTTIPPEALIIFQLTWRMTRAAVPATNSAGISNESPRTVPEIKLKRAYAKTPRTETRSRISRKGLP